MYEKIKFFKDNFHDYLKDMKESEHGLDMFNANPYHVEGDVWAHTMAVCSQVQHSSDVVQWACLLHDIGKPDCRGIETKNDLTKVNFRNHGPYGIYKALEVLNAASTKEFNISEEDKIMILKLVAKHQDLYNGTVNYSTIYETNFYIYLAEVSDADSTGGISEKFDRKELNSPNKITTEIKEDQPELVLLIGAQNVGKTTICRKEYLKYTRISRDDILVNLAKKCSSIPGKVQSYIDCWNYCDENNLQKEVDKILLKKFNCAIKNKDDIVIDMTCMSKKSRRKWLNVKNYNKTAVLVLAEHSEIYKRNANRFGKTLAPLIIKSTMKRLVWPDYNEFSKIEVRI